MIEYSKNTVLDCPLEDIIPSLTDNGQLRVWNTWFTGMRQVTDGPLQTGTRFNQNWNFNRNQINLNLEVTDFNPPERISFSTHTPKFDYYAQVQLGKVLKGTSLYFRSKIVLKGFKFKFLEKLLGSTTEKDFAEAHEAGFRRLKKYLETRKRI